MSAPTPTDPDVVDPARRYGDRPVGTWVVAGVLTFTVVAIWILQWNLSTGGGPEARLAFFGTGVVLTLPVLSRTLDALALRLSV